MDGMCGAAAAVVLLPLAGAEGEALLLTEAPTELGGVVSATETQQHWSTNAGRSTKQTKQKNSNSNRNLDLSDAFNPSMWASSFFAVSRRQTISWNIKYLQSVSLYQLHNDWFCCEILYNHFPIKMKYVTHSKFTSLCGSCNDYFCLKCCRLFLLFSL